MYDIKNLKLKIRPEKEYKYNSLWNIAAKFKDVIVDYLGEQFIVELKIWHGNEYHERGEEQLVGYLDYFRKDKGYMISFNFNKKKAIGVKEIQVGKRVIVEAVV